MKKTKHKYRRVLDAVYSTPWPMEPKKLDQVRELIDMRHRGEAFSENELSAMFGPPDDEDDEPLYEVNADGIAIMRLYGVISQRMNMFARFSGGTSTEMFGKAFMQAMRDPAVKGILIEVDSPGGTLPGVPELAAMLREARGKKPVWAIANSLCASAAYWIASAAELLLVSPSASVGSIGVYWVHTEYSKQDEAVGRTRTMVKAGKWKALGNDVEPLTKEGRDRLQEWVDESYQMFVAAIAKNRGVSVEEVLAGFGEGDTEMGESAVRERLADRVATFDQALLQLTEAVQKPAANPSNRGVIKMNEKIKAALVEKGLITADATDELATAVMKTFFVVSGKEQPKTDEEVLAALTAKKEEAAAPPKELSADDVKTQVAAIERDRVTGIQALCDLANMPQLAKGLIADTKCTVEKAMPVVKEALERRNKALDDGGEGGGTGEGNGENAAFEAEYKKDAAAYTKAGMSLEEYVKMRRFETGKDKLTHKMPGKAA